MPALYPLARPVHCGPSYWGANLVRRVAVLIAGWDLF